MRGVRAYLRAPSRRAVLSAVVVGGLLRLVWVLIATRTSPSPYSDPSEFLSMASTFGHGRLPRFHGGAPTALFPPGYSFVLAPFVTLGESTGLISAAFAASLVNALAGPLTIGFTAVIARRWLSARAAVVAAWLMALAPAQIYFTSTAHNETVFTAFAVGTVALIVHRRSIGPVGGRLLVGVGALIGFTALIRSPGILLLVPVVLVVAGGGSVRRWLEPVPSLLVGVVVVLSPWAVRNGIQVGHWSPFSTGNATALCLGHHPDFMRVYDPVHFRNSDRASKDCFTHSPFDDERLGLVPPGTAHGPDEARWYSDTTSFAVRSALSNLGAEPGWTLRKLRVLALTETGAVHGARNFAEEGWAGSFEWPLMAIAHLWLWGVEVGAVVGAIRFRRRRGALPIIVCAGVFLLSPIVAIAYPHQHHTAMPFLVVLAAAAVVGAPASREVTGEAQAVAADV